MRRPKWLANPNQGAGLASRQRRGTQRARRLRLDELEPRVTPSTLPPPNPIDPTRGEANLLRVVQMIADKQNLNAQDHFPVPFAVVVSAGGAETTIKNWKAGAPLRIDADQNRDTGRGGHDLQVEVNTDRYTNAQGRPDWRLRLNVNRIGSAPFAENVNVVVAFPYDAFNTETLPAKPNLLMGYQSRLPGTPGQADYVTGIDGGIAPETFQMVLTPHILGGTTHAFEWAIDTTGAANPLTFLAGEFDGDPGSNTIANALGWSAYVQDVPAHIGAELKVAENAIGSPAVDSTMDLHWTASAPSLVAFDYLEAESRGAAAAPETADYATQIVADQMPTDERFVLRQDEAGGALTLNHDSNAPIHEMTFLKRRSDGLAVTGVAADEDPAADAVPTHVALTLGLRGSEVLDVNANTLDLHVQATQVGGFNDTAQFFEQFHHEYVALRVKNAPDQTASYDGAAKSFVLAATNPGETVPFSEVVIDDDGRVGRDNAPLNLDLPAKYAEVPSWHLWSIYDDGTHGTSVARALDASAVAYDHDAPTIKETVDLHTVVAHPLQTELRSGLLSAVQPPFGTSPDPYIEVEGCVEDVPVGHTIVRLDFPMTASWEAEGRIEEICMAGHIGHLNFGVILEDNPQVGGFDFRPEGQIEVKAETKDGQPDFFSGNAAIAYDVTGFQENVLPLPPADADPNDAFHTAAETFFPNNTRLKEARLRLDHVPSLKATWHDEDDHTYVDIDTVAATGPHAYVGGVQIQVSTQTTLAGTRITCDNVKDFIPPAATPESEHYALLKDVAGEQTLKFGVFGVDSFHFASNDTKSPSTYSVDWALDPSRPATASRIDVDAHPASTGALGTFFGGSEVTGPLTISAVPADMHVDSDFDPSFSTATLFPSGLPVPLEVNQVMNVDGTDIFVHAEQVPQFFTVSWNTAGPTTNLSVVATDQFGNPDAAKVVEVIFRNPNGLPAGGDLFQDAANPLRRFNVQVDNVPSLNASLTTAGNPHVNIDTTAAAGPFQYLGGLRMSASTNAGPPLPTPPIIPPIPPTYPAPTPADNPYLRLRDVGPNKLIEVGLFGLDNIDVLVNNVASTATVAYNADAARPFTAVVHSVNGRFFPGHTVDAGLIVNALPRSETLTVAANGQSLTSTAGAQGQIASIQLGGTDLVDPAFNPGTQSAGTYDNTLIDVEAHNLPNVFGYSFNPAGSFNLTANNTPAFLPDRIGGVSAWLRSPTGIPGTGGILGSPIKDARLRLDDIPGLGATWSSAGGNTAFALDTAGTGVYLGGAQLGLSTAYADVAPFAAPASGAPQALALSDRGGVARMSAGLFGLENVNFGYTKNPNALDFKYQADAARRLDVRIDARSGSSLTGDSDVAATLTVADIPATWELSTDLKKRFKAKGSAGIAAIDANAVIDDSPDNVNNPDRLVAQVRNLPAELDVVMDKVESTFDEQTKIRTETKTTYAHASGTVGSIFFEETRDLPSAGNRPSWNLVQLTGLPGRFDMVEKTVTDETNKADPKKTETTDATVATPAGVPAPLPFVRVVTAVDSKAATIANHLATFQNIPATPGGLVQRTGFEKEIDDRYWPASVRSRLDGLFGPTGGLDSPGGQLQDHVLMRKYGERGIPGVTLNLSGAATQSTKTDANGFYAFAGLAPGTYGIAEVQPAGAVDGNAHPGTLGGTAVPNAVNGIVVGQFQDPNDNPVTVSGFNYYFGEKTPPNPGLEAGPTPGNPAAPGTLSGTVYLDEYADGQYQVDNLVDYTDLQLSNFQELHTKEAPGGIQTVDLKVPGTGPHPFFFGSAQRDEFTFAKIENLPSEVKVDLNEKEHLYLDTSTSVGRVDFYTGPIGGAGHGAEAIRATLTGAPTAGGVFVNTPTSIHLDFKDVAEFPGGASFQASGPFEARLVFQEKDQRMVGALQMEDAVLAYGIEGPTFAADVITAADLANELPEPLKTTLNTAIDVYLLLPGTSMPSIATALGLFKVFAKVDTVGNVSGQGASGFFGLYDLYKDPKPLDPGGPAPSQHEFVPRLTASIRDFRGLDASFEIQLDPKPWEWDFPPLDLELNLPDPQFGPGGGITVDFWDTGLFDFSIGPIEVLDIEIFPEITIADPPDYSTGNPWHVIPFLFNPNGPLDPFPPQLAGSVGSGAAPEDVIAAVPAGIVTEARNRWTAAGLDANGLGAVRVAVADLPDGFLGTVVGDTVWVDHDGAGHGWFVDPTPGDDSEFPAAAGCPAFGRMDLLTVVTHEIGRLLGLTVADATVYPVMAETLAPGVRLVDRSATVEKSADGSGPEPMPVEGGTALPLVSADGLVALVSPDAIEGPPPAILDRGRGAVAVATVVDEPTGLATGVSDPQVMVAAYDQRPAEVTDESGFVLVDE